MVFSETQNGADAELPDPPRATGDIRHWWNHQGQAEWSPMFSREEGLVVLTRDTGCIVRICGFGKSWGTPRSNFGRKPGNPYENLPQTMFSSYLTQSDADGSFSAPHPEDLGWECDLGTPSFLIMLVFDATVHIGEEELSQGPEPAVSADRRGIHR